MTFEEWWSKQFYNDNLKELLEKAWCAGFESGIYVSTKETKNEFFKAFSKKFKNY